MEVKVDEIDKKLVQTARQRYNLPDSVTDDEVHQMNRRTAAYASEKLSRALSNFWAALRRTIGL